jgi:hypothetical protein
MYAFLKIFYENYWNSKIAFTNNLVYFLQKKFSSVKKVRFGKRFG